jgi:hypothetical protein
MLDLVATQTGKPAFEGCPILDGLDHRQPVALREGAGERLIEYLLRHASTKV